MAERTFTEGEAYALVADAITRETAEAKAATAAAEDKAVTLSNEKDALELRATAAEEAKVKAEQELADYKAQVETEKANEGKRSTRLAEVAEVAPALKLEGERADRIVAMEDGVFTDYVTSLREVAAAGPHAWTPMQSDAAKCKTCGDSKSAGLHTAGSQKANATSGELPRESAAFGGGASTTGASASGGSLKSLQAARRAAKAPASA